MMWSGAHVVVIASGPSLTEDDVCAVKRWRGVSEDRRVIVCNTSFRAAPWADVLVAQDLAWWNVYGDEAVSTFRGEMLSGCVPLPKHRHRVSRVTLPQRIASSLTGAVAIALAAHRGAARVILLGYDCAVRYVDGVRVAHWHAAHPRPLGDAGSVARFSSRLERLAQALRTDAPHCEIINASRVTECRAWPRVPLEEALA